MHQLPEPPAAPAAGQTTPTDADRDRIRRLMAAVDEIPTSYRNTDPVPAVGAAPPVAQPGRPPMSQRAVDASTLMLSGSVLTATLGGSATAILWASGHADPAVVATVFGAPAFLALAIARILKRAKDVVPPEIHQHYNGPVDQRTQHSKSSGVWVKNTNQQ